MAAVSGVGTGDPVVVPVLVTDGVVAFPPKLNKLPSTFNAVSTSGIPVLIVPSAGVANSVDPGNCGRPNRARIYGSVGSAPPSC